MHPKELNASHYDAFCLELMGCLIYDTHWIVNIPFLLGNHGCLDQLTHID